MATSTAVLNRPLGAWSLERVREGRKSEHRARLGSLTEAWVFLVVHLRGRRGKIAIYEAERALALDLTRAQDYLLFRFPLGAFRNFPSRVGGLATERLSCPAELGMVDPIVLALAESLLDSLDEPERRRAPFVEHVVRALVIHLAARFGAPQVVLPADPAPPWLARAKELLSAQTAAAPSVELVAAACALSPSAFSRAFRRYAGVPPHRFQLQQRIERAKTLLEEARSLTEVAVSCGFADQSHFTRTFRAHTGSTPRRFRDALARARAKFTE